MSVLVEKPFACSLAEGRILIDRARERGVLAMAAHTFLYSPAVQVVGRMIRSGEIGDPLYLQASRVNLGIHQSDVSVVWDLAPHDLSILRSWIGEPPEWVSAIGRSTHGTSRADVAFIDVGFPSGCIANLHLSWLAPTKVRRMTVVGSKKMVVYEDTNYEEPVKIYNKGMAALPDPKDFGQFKATYRLGDVSSPHIEALEPLRAEVDDFLARVAAGEIPDEREETALEVVAITEAAEHSLARGGEIIHL